MDKREFNNIISRFEPDDAMKERIERRIFNMDRIDRKPKRSIRKTVIISLCAAAAAIAVAVPVMAEHIPAVRNAVEIFKIRVRFSKEPLYGNDVVDEFAESIYVYAEGMENERLISDNVSVNHAESTCVYVEYTKNEELTADNAPVNPDGSYIDINGGNFSVTVSDYTLVKNVNDLDLTGDICSPYETNSHRIDENGNIIDMTLVVFDYTIRNNRDEELQLCAGNEKLIPSDDMTVCLNGGDPAYLAPKDNGGKNAYMLNFAPYEERTVKIGFMIDDKYADKELIFSIDGMDGGEVCYLAFKKQ